MPVMPDDEAYDYLPTQAIADFLASNANPLLHGIIYPSVQGGKRNIVLFHKASRVQTLEIPEGTEISVSMQHWTEDGPEIDYWVSEQVPPQAVSKSGSIPIKQSPMLDDNRQFTLKLDLSSLEVRHITGVSFTTESYPVTRHRSEKKDEEF